MELSVKEYEYFRKEQLYVLKVISGDVYGLVNVRNKKQIEVSKAELIKNISNGTVLVSNVYLRKMAKGGISVVCKEPEKVKRVGSKTKGQDKNAEAVYKGRVHYQGILGDFWYNPKEFKVVDTEEDLEWEDSFACLYYIGNKSKGINIPQGIKDCTGMFYGCTTLIEAPSIPETVVNCRSMFEGCTNLQTALVISKNVQICDSMFKDCIKLVKTFAIPEGVVDCQSMFNGCKSLKASKDLPDSVQDAGWMFKDCTSLETVGTLSNTLFTCEQMFSNCCKLTKAPKIPKSVQIAFDMFKGCSEEVQKQGEYNLEHRR